MKKKRLSYMLILFVCLISAFVYISNLLPKGDTIEGREVLLDNAISRGRDWSITKEIEIDDYIISCAYSANGKSTIAVFEPVSNGKYKFSTSTNGDNTDIIIGGTTKYILYKTAKKCYYMTIINSQRNRGDLYGLIY